MRKIRVSISYRFTVSSRLTAFACECPTNNVMHYRPYQCHTSALVSPWMNNGNALAYIKEHDRDVDYRKLVRRFVHLSYQSPYCLDIDSGNSKRGQSAPLYEPINYTWKSERGLCTLFMIAMHEHLSHHKEKVVIGNDGQPLITDFALAKVRYSQYSDPLLNFNPIARW